MTVPRVKTVILLLDRSELSHEALPVAVELAGRLDAEIRLLTVIRRESDRADAEGRLVPVRAERLAGTDVVVDADPAHAIQRELQAYNGAVGCMVSRGRSRSAPVVGSVTAEVIRRGPVRCSWSGHSSVG